MLTQEGMSLVDQALATAQDAVLEADERVLSLVERSERYQALHLAVLAIRVLTVMNVITVGFSDDAITRLLAFTLAADGLEREEVDEYCQSLNRFRAELDSISDRLEG